MQRRRETGAVPEGETTADAPSRADARRNRSRILEVAEEAFAEEGLGVPVDEIARRAGVGAGTLYRNFPTKEALFEAVLVRHMEALAAEAKELERSEQPATALFEVLRRLTEEAGRKRNLVEALMDSGADVGEPLAASKRTVETAIGALLARAQATGEVRDDVTVDDLLGVVVGCALKPYAADPAAQSRLVSVFCDGLRR